MSIADWYSSELERWKEITPICGIESRILSHYLTTHEETPMEKKFGDRFGRLILGWDSEKQEPIIGYRFGYVPPELLKHNITDIPQEYAYTDWWTGTGKRIVFGNDLIIPGLPDENDGKEDLPYNDDLPF